MLLVSLAIGVSWALLLGSAYLARVVFRWSRGPSAVVVAVAYAACAASALGWLGLGSAGWFGAFGLLLPCAAAMVLVAVHPRSSGGR